MSASVTTFDSLDLSAFLESARRFSRKLAELKRVHPLEEYGWYPYDSLTAVSILGQLLEHDFPLLSPLLFSEPVLDIGCADGDLAFFFESLGATVDAIDYSEMNFNQLAGARRLRELLGSKAGIYSVNLDWYFELPRSRYGLILFLGTLYHLKNPFYVLETLARRGAYCLLSTRVAQLASASGPRIANHPLAYLLDARETNNDPTNYWIFSETGLLRLVDRAGWSVVHKVHAGCLRDSNPTGAKADERIFLLLKSRVRFPDLHVRLLGGWHPVEENGLRWTEKNFSFEVLLPTTRTAKAFALTFLIPKEVITAGGGVELSCQINGEPGGTSRYSSPGTHTFRGVFPPGIGGRATFDFHVEHQFRPAEGDVRELGVMVSFADESAGGRSGLPFRIS